jgi:hypothetical protein
MLPVIPKQLVIARHRVDFRKGWDGLLAESYRLGFDPYAGDCVVFIKGDRTQLRALLGDALGLVLISRRFEGGSLKLPWGRNTVNAPQVVTMSEVSLLLEGATCTVTRRVKPWKPGEKTNLP